MQPIHLGDQVYLDDGDETCGAVRDLVAAGLIIYIENGGEFVVPLELVKAVHSGKVILRADRLHPRMRAAIDHAHDAEVSGI